TITCRRVPPSASVTAMDLLSSTTTATTFCCGRSVATLNAGCHNSRSSKATSVVCNSQTNTLRAPRIDGTKFACRRQILQASAAATATVSKPSNHSGHLPSSTKVPLENTLAGYLKKNSNMWTASLYLNAS